MTKTSKFIFSFLPIILLVGMLSGCGDQGAVQLSSKPRLAPALAEGDLTELAGNNNAFAFEMYRQLGNAQSGNLLFSPYSISQSMAMVYAGARGETAEQMAVALHFSQPQETLHDGFNFLGRRFDDNPALPLFGRPDFQLKIANAAWGQQDYKFLPEFLDMLGQYYGAGMHTTDFNNPFAALGAINRWTENATNGKIKNALTEIPPDTKLILANAIYLNAKWQKPFIKLGNGDFHPLTGATTSVPVMYLKEDSFSIPYAKGQGYEMVALPYQGRPIEMVFLVPDRGNFEKIEALLTNEWIDARLKEGNQVVYLTMPKFRLEPPTMKLKPAFEAIGMTDAFSDNADFSGIDGGRHLKLHDVLQKTYIQIDEEGTEAAAATFPEFVLISASLGAVSMTIDRPFIFFIRDTETGTILFLGRVTSLP